MTDPDRDKPDLDRVLTLSGIMAEVHALAEIAWPRDDCGVSAMPDEALRAIMAIQSSVGKALKLPDDLPLLTGEAIDMDIAT